MNEELASFIRDRRIDSFQKLSFLLFLFQHPKLTGTSQQFAKRLYLGEVSLLDKIINDLCQAGLVNCVGNRYMLDDEPDVRFYLKFLTQTFEDPLARQELLDHVKNNVVADHTNLVVN